MEHRSTPVVGVEAEVQLLPSPKPTQASQVQGEQRGVSTAVCSRAAAWLPLNVQGIKLWFPKATAASTVCAMNSLLPVPVNCIP